MAILLIGIAFLAGDFLPLGSIGKIKENSAPEKLLKGVSVAVYKSPTCGCCGGYVAYLKNQGALVEVYETEQMSAVKEQNRVPINLQGCHTSLVGGYVVEGHVPAEAIRRLLYEKPEVLGISLPEMPAGSPGMGGEKVERFKVYRIARDGSEGGIFFEL